LIAVENWTRSLWFALMIVFFLFCLTQTWNLFFFFFFFFFFFSGEIYIGEDVQTRKKVAIKTEAVDKKKQMLKAEAAILRSMQGKKKKKNTPTKGRRKLTPYAFSCSKLNGTSASSMDVGGTREWILLSWNCWGITSRSCAAPRRETNFLSPWRPPSELKCSVPSRFCTKLDSFIGISSLWASFSLSFFFFYAPNL